MIKREPKTAYSVQDYCSISRSFIEYAGSAETEWRFGYPNVLSQLEPLAGKRVLDFGCGGGNFSAALADRGASVLGLDSSSEMVESAMRNHGDRIQFDCFRDGAALKEVGNPFDAAVANFVFCTFPTLALVEKTAHLICDCLVADGRLIVLHANWERANGANFRSFRLDSASELKTGCKITVTLKHEPPITIEDYFFSRLDYQQALLCAGFTRVNCIEVPPEPDAEGFLDERHLSPFYLLVAER